MRNVPQDFHDLAKDLRLDLEQAMNSVIETKTSSSQLLELPERFPKVIIITGYPKAGKNILADYLCNNYHNVISIDYSAPLINEVNNWLLAFGKQIDHKNKSCPENRHLLQAWAEARRYQDANHWIEHLQSCLDLAFDHGVRTVVLSGARDKTDLQPLQFFPGEVWRVLRSGNTYQADHAIERRADKLPVDKIIENKVEGNFSCFIEEIEKTIALFV